LVCAGLYLAGMELDFLLMPLLVVCVYICPSAPFRSRVRLMYL
jgi:hypothetical protein